MNTALATDPATLRRHVDGTLAASRGPHAATDGACIMHWRQPPFSGRELPALDQHFLGISLEPAAFSWDAGSGWEDALHDRMQAVFLPAGTPTLWSSRNATETLHIFFPDAALASLPPVQRAAVLLPGTRLGSALLPVLASRCREALQPGVAASRLMSDLIGLLICTALLDARVGGPAPALARGGLAPWQATRVCDHLQARIRADVGLDELAALVGLSPAHFCRAFKRSTGLPPHQWQIARRIERAQELLVKTGLSVTEVAAQVGYGDPNQLARVFRRHVGATPGRYRRERRG